MMNKADTTSPAPELVIVPMPGKGHLAATIEFAKHLLHHHDKLSITILIIPQQSSALSDPDHVLHDRINYIPLSRLATPPNSKPLHYAEIYTPQVKDAIANILSGSEVRLLGVVIDMFCTSMIDVANEFDVPTYLFFTAGAGCLGFFRYIPERYDRVGLRFQPGDDSELIIPSYAYPVPANALPSFLLKEEYHSSVMALSRRFKECKGIFVNTFLDLESHALKSLLSGGGELPPVYAVGPLVDLTSLERKSTVGDKADKIMRWLDDQPPSTVVLLCFGSRGSFRDPSQLKEIALGLERSGHRFLWSVRKASTSKVVFSPPEDYTDYEELMLDGFFERIGERGMVCGWVPQMEVLSHPAIGGFVSHCGWNSILESLWFGVPIAAWPMYAEQQLNAFLMVKELGLAVEVKLGYTMEGGDLVMADDIEKAVTCLMDNDSEVRKRVQVISKKTRKAIMDGGSSHVSFQQLMKDMFENISL